MNGEMIVSISKWIWGAMVSDKPCTHAKGECDQARHKEPTPIGAVVVMAAIAAGLWGFSQINSLNTWAQGFDRRMVRVETIVITGKDPGPDPATAPASIPKQADAGARGGLIPSAYADAPKE